MAKYDIVRVNKLTAGDVRGLIDMDIKVDYSDEPDASSRTPETKRVVFEFENYKNQNMQASFQTKNDEQYILPLNDILDLCIKSQFSQDNNFNVPQNMDEFGIEHNNDQNNNNKDNIPKNNTYIVLDNYPIDLCQCNGDAFLMTQLTTKTPYMVKSNSDENMQNNPYQFSSHEFSLCQDQIQTHLFAGSDERTGNVDKAFDVCKDVREMQYNYVVDIDQNKNNTNYFNGDIFGNGFLCKNMYNSTYSTEMPSEYQIKNCRQYCGIQPVCGNSLVLKYYDNVNYQLANTDGNQYNAISSQSAYPYQKVEYFIPNKFSVEAKHKSNLFSIKLEKTGLDDLSMEQNKLDDPNKEKLRKAYAERIKRDIANGVKSLVDSIAPANTQLFKTYFVNEIT